MDLGARAGGGGGEGGPHSTLSKIPGPIALHRTRMRMRLLLLLLLLPWAAREEQGGASVVGERAQGGGSKTQSRTGP